MNLESDTFRIRNATAQDAKILCQWWNDGQIMAHAGFPNGLGITESEIAASLKKDNDLQRRLVIELDNEPIGEMNYRTPEEKIAEIGIKICEASQQNQGYGTKYLKMLLTHLFMSMDYDKIKLDTNLNNDRAQHVYERLGFRKVSTNIDSWKDQLGEFQSSVDFEMTKAEYGNLYGNEGL